MPITQKHRLLAIGTALGPDLLGLRTMAVQERLSRPFQIEVELTSEDGQLDFDKVIGQNATIRLELNENDTRYFNGYISRLVQIANRGGYAQYRATIVPWLWFLTRTADCRIFQDKTIPEVLEEVFKAHGYNDYKLSLTATYPKWEYCVQYRETDFSFVSRLMEQEGIYYFFQHENGKHTLVLADSISAHNPFPGCSEISFCELQKGFSPRQDITEWLVEKEVQTVGYALGDYDFTRPKASIQAVANVNRQYGGAVFEIYDYPGEFDQQGDGDRLASVRLDELQSQLEVVHAQTSARGVAAGCTFKLKNHPRTDQNREYLITSAELRADAGEFASESGGGSSSGFFAASFTAIEKTQQFRPPRITPKPVIQGPQTAFVVGKSGEEVDADEYGRVKVQFHWDRYGKMDENSSCWVRVAQIWAGKKWGALFTPRIGQEVLIEFLEGDPDQPIITGRVYNGLAKPPYDPKAKKTISTLKSNSSKGGGGFNEIRFDDEKGKEQVFFHAEKDEDVRVKNDAKEWIGNERHLVVKKDQLEKVEGDKHSTVKGNSLSKVEGDRGDTIKGGRFVQIDGADNLTLKGDQNAKVEGDVNLKGGKNINEEAGQKLSIKAGQDLHEKAGQNYAMEAGQNIHLKGGMNVVIEAGMQLSLKVGGNFVDIGPAGVSIKGTMVNINSGGAPGSGSGSSPTAPAAPEAPDPPKDPKDAADADPGEKDETPPAPKPPKPTSYSASAQVLKYAAANGTPFCAECEKLKRKNQPAGGGTGRFAMFGMLLSAMKGATPPRTCTLEVSVTYCHTCGNTPLANVIVKIEGPQKDEKATESDGKATFASIPEGEYKVEAQNFCFGKSRQPCHSGRATAQVKISSPDSLHVPLVFTCVCYRLVKDSFRIAKSDPKEKKKLTQPTIEHPVHDEFLKGEKLDFGQDGIHTGKEWPQLADPLEESRFEYHHVRHLKLSVAELSELVIALPENFHVGSRALPMVKRIFKAFTDNEGGKRNEIQLFRDPELNLAAANHENCIDFCRFAMSSTDMKAEVWQDMGLTEKPKRIHQILYDAGWDINNVSKDSIRDLGIPAFNKKPSLWHPFEWRDIVSGLLLSVDTIPHVHVWVKKYDYRSCIKKYDIELTFVLYDAFGLDIKDLIVVDEKRDDSLLIAGMVRDAAQDQLLPPPASNEEIVTEEAVKGFTAWWQLQHQHDFWPLITQMVVSRRFSNLDATSPDLKPPERDECQ
jgi:type VI secretion system secreted protein VgrG